MDGRSWYTGTLKCVYGRVTGCYKGKVDKLVIGGIIYTVKDDDILKYRGKEGWWQIIISGSKKEIVGFVEKI